jgi:hypothetical protein
LCHDESHDSHAIIIELFLSSNHAWLVLLVVLPHLDFVPASTTVWITHCHGLASVGKRREGLETGYKDNRKRTRGRAREGRN